MNLHHAGVLVADISESAAIYLALGYQPRTAIVHDPIQTARVQFFSLPGDSAYLELVSPDGPESLLANALRKGGGLHHLCYMAVNIEAACESLRALGWFLISPPVPAVAFDGRRVAWLRGPDRLLTELVERGQEGEL
jgi:methylmalonyl-CoA/ethylmalonyl-CoA epimerase